MTSNDRAHDSAASPKASAAVEAWRRYDDDEQRLSAHVSERMLDLAQIRAGSKVLDIATGRGEPALRAAARVAPDGEVVGTDISDEMLDFTRARAAAQSLSNLRLIVTSGESLEGIPADAFDAALCRWGLMYFDRPIEALKATRRRLKPDARLVLAVWAEPERVDWWSMPRDILARHTEVPPIDFTVAGTFRHATSAALRHDLDAAGFVVDHEEEMDTAVMEASSPKGLIDWCLTFGLARALAEQPPAVRAAWRNEMVSDAERHRDPNGLYRLRGTTRLVLATLSPLRQDFPPEMGESP